MELVKVGALTVLVVLVQLAVWPHTRALWQKARPPLKQSGPWLRQKGPCRMGASSPLQSMALSATYARKGAGA
eukprot:1176583-Alexandrium_andersonii.AAC.1